MTTSRPRPSLKGRRVLPLSGIGLAAALVLAGCGDADQPSQSDPAQGNDDGAAQLDSGGADQQSSAEQDEAVAESFAVAELTDVVGTGIGTVTFTEVDQGVRVQAQLHELQAGFRGITIHENGLCEPQSESPDGVFGDYQSAGDHLPGHVAQDPGVVEGEEAPEESTDPQLENLPEDEPFQTPPPVDHPGHAGDLPNVLINEDGTGQLSLVTDRFVPQDLLDGEGAAVIVHAEPDNHANVPDRYTGYGPDYETLVTGDSGSRVACGVVTEQ